MILKTEKNANYTTLCNIALNDPELSLKAKGLFAFLMSKPTDWTISYRGLMTQLKEGQWSILGALKELEAAGYLQRDLEQDETGQLYVSSVLREQPRSTVRGKLTHGATTVKTVRRKPTHGKPTRGKPTPIVKTDELNTDKEKLNKKERAAVDTRGQHSETSAVLSQLVRKYGPAEASKRFKALRQAEIVQTDTDTNLSQNPVKSPQNELTAQPNIANYSDRLGNILNTSIVGVVSQTPDA